MSPARRSLGGVGLCNKPRMANGPGMQLAAFGVLLKSQTSTGESGGLVEWYLPIVFISNRKENQPCTILHI